MTILRLTVILTCLLSAACSDECFDYNTDYYGYDLQDGQYVTTDGPDSCQLECAANPLCQYWTWDRTYHNACWLKSDKGNAVHFLVWASSQSLLL